MALICESGARECDGCMNCHEDADPKMLCDKCSEGIYEGDGYYALDGENVCSDCIDKYRQIA